MKKQLYSLALFFSLVCQTAFSCGDFVLQGKDGSIINGRSMEFAIPMDSSITARARGEEIQSEAPNGKKGLHWISKYGYLAIDSLGMHSACDGFNEKGLSIGALWLPTTQYQKVTTENESKALLLEQLGAWVLGNFSTVDEVKEALSTVVIWGRPLEKLGSIPPLHFAIHDASGKSLVIECINGEQKIYDNPIGILTNYPTFPWHLDNLGNYVHLSSVNDSLLKTENFSFHFPGQGSGLLGIPGDWMPPSRFIRLAFFKEFSQSGNNALESINLAEHLLNTVDIPLGDIRDSSRKPTDFTQWAVIKDLTNKVLYYRTYRDMHLHCIDMKKLDLSPGNSFLSIPLVTAPVYQDMTSALLSNKKG